MEFGIFDHLDRSPLPLADTYEQRLKVIEAFDRSGFHAYHLAEHHATPLGMAPSPSVFLAAIAQRTRRIRLGPLIYALPLYHPLRLAEEICMLDHMSGGRLDIGFGRGASPIELELYGRDPDDARAVFDEAFAVVMQALTRGRVDFRGTHFRFDDVPMELSLLQQPHPPMWYGVHAPDSAVRCARQGTNIVSLTTAEDSRRYAEAFRAEWRNLGREQDALPFIGLGRMIVVAPTDAEAVRIAERAYPLWHRSFYHLFARYDRMPNRPRPPEFAKMMADGRGIAGSPRTVTENIRRQMATAASNYFLGQFCFGDLTLDEMLCSVELFAAEVMPALRDA
jgi:alkanesulfonate monooxygenase SsuD/methylene tetrahydromethanopterin reductase-like flavin-dependent oxidoreductase (luciferase family)